MEYLLVTVEEANLFFQFVSYRYEKSSTIIIFVDWQELFNDPVIVSVILDRPLHH
jgi:DNA replication protein DnaC